MSQNVELNNETKSLKRIINEFTQLEGPSRSRVFTYVAGWLDEQRQEEYRLSLQQPLAAQHS